MPVSVMNIHASYGARPVLRDVSHEFRSGRVTALIGPNGCGKTTLLRVIMGFVSQASGTVRLLGRPVADYSRKDFARHIAYLPQTAHCPDHMRIGDLVELGGYARMSLLGGPSAADRAHFRDVLSVVGLADKAHLPVNALSGGERQRAWIALVLAQDADTILMDEPVNHLDVKYQYAVLELIRDLSVRMGKTVIVVLHDINLTATFADDLVMLKDGQLVTAGPLADTLTGGNIQRVFDIAADVFHRNGRLICQPCPAAPRRPGDKVA